MANISDTVVDRRHIGAALLLELLLTLVQICHHLQVLLFPRKYTSTVWVQYLPWSEDRVLRAPKHRRYMAFLVLFATLVSVEGISSTICMPLSLLVPVKRT